MATGSGRNGNRAVASIASEVFARWLHHQYARSGDIVSPGDTLSEHTYRIICFPVCRIVGPLRILFYYALYYVALYQTHTVFINISVGQTIVKISWRQKYSDTFFRFCHRHSAPAACY